MWSSVFVKCLSSGQLHLLFLLQAILQLGNGLLDLPQNTRCRIHYNNLPSSVHLDPGCSHVTCGTSCGALCPAGSRDCQKNGVIVCKVTDLSVPFECGYDEDNCYVFHRVLSGCTNGGSVSADGTCACPPGYIGEFCHHYVHTCHDIYLRNQSSVSGEYSLLTYQGAAVTVWCIFRNDVIITYFSKSAIASLATEELSLHYNTMSEVDVVAKWSNGSQTESTLKQISTFSDIPLGVMMDEFVNYTSPNNNNLGSYLYLGFVPKSMISDGSMQGYRSNEQDRTFENCDSNPNSYFVFYSNPNNQSPTRTSGNLTNNHLMSHWNKDARMMISEDYLPEDYFHDTEIHFGGCGGYAISYNWNEVGGLSLGLKYNVQ